MCWATGAEDVDAEGVVPGVLEGGGDEFQGDAFSALRLGHFGMPDRHPAMAVGFAFEVAGLAILHDLEATARDVGGVVHGRSSGLNDRALGFGSGFAHRATDGSD
jgi:hypothetical protein